MRPAHPCAVASCPELVRNAPRCPAHAITREERNPKDPEQAQFYGSTRWKKIRSFIRTRDPICKLCHRNPTTNVDHIDANWRNNDPSNLRGLCSICDRKHSGSQHYHKRKQVIR